MNSTSSAAQPAPQATGPGPERPPRPLPAAPAKSAKAAEAAKAAKSSQAAQPAKSAETPAQPAAGARYDSVIGPSITINGDISGDEDLTIHGQVEGGINFRENSVSIGRQGRVVADIVAKNIIVEGKLKGDLRGSEQVTVASTGQVSGDIHSPRVVLNDGCQFKGAIDMESKLPDRDTPHIRAQLSHARRFPERLAERLVPPQPGDSSKV